MSETIRKAIKKIAGKGNVSFITGKVVEVNEGERTCDVEPADGSPVLYDVFLQSMPDVDGGGVFLPSVDSVVVVGMLDDNVGVVVQQSGFDKMIVKVGEQELVLDKNGLKWMVQQNDLKSLVGELIDILLNFQVTTNTGVSIAVVPNLVTRLTQLKADFGKLLQ